MNCYIRDDKFVEPCAPLKEQCDKNIRGGLELIKWYIHGVPSRSFVVLSGVKSKNIKPLALNFCPFCGSAICSPFQKEKHDT